LRQAKLFAREQESSVMTEQESAIVGRSETIQDFCDSEGMSLSLYYDLRRRGIGPKEMRAGGFVRISPQAHLDWRQSMVKLGESKAAQLERAWRSERGRIARSKRRNKPKRRAKRGHR
jgi:hypothetical protein